MGLSKSSSKQEVYSDTIIPQEARRALNRQINPTSKAAGKKNNNNNQKNPQSQQNEEDHKNKSRNK